MSSFEIQPLLPGLADVAARFVASRVDGLRKASCSVPPAWTREQDLADRIRRMTRDGNALAAFDGDRMAGFVAWHVVEGFRGTGRRAAVVTETVHGASDRGPALAAYADLYAAAAVRWTDQGCVTHVVGTLAGENHLQNWLYWNGFGVTVVDATSMLEPLIGLGGDQTVSCRKAGVDDVPAIRSLEEHLAAHLHGAAALMPLHAPRSPALQAEFLKRSGNGVWLAFDDAEPIGLMRFEAHCQGAGEIVRSEDTIAISGAVVKPGRRGKGVGTRLLGEGARAYAAAGLTRCSVDFESFNPEATTFWLAHFRPACLWLARHPERFL